MRKQVREFLVIALKLNQRKKSKNLHAKTQSRKGTAKKKLCGLFAFLSRPCGMRFFLFCFGLCIMTSEGLAESTPPLSGAGEVSFAGADQNGESFARVMMKLNCIDAAKNTPRTPLNGGIGFENFFSMNTTVTSDSSKTKSSPKTILFFGNSLTAGFGLDPSQAFPAVIQQKLDTLKLPYQVINAGLSGETSAGGLRRIDWLLNRKIKVLVLELGANDGLRGIALGDTRRNLQEIITRTKKKNPQAQIVLAGMMVPPNLGVEYRQQFQRLFPELAKQNRAALIPFLLDGVGGVPELNLPDGIHPTAEGHKKVAENVWKVLRPLLLSQ